MIRFNPVYTSTWLQLSGSKIKLKSEIAATGRRVLYPVVFINVILLQGYRFLGKLWFLLPKLYSKFDL